MNLYRKYRPTTFSEVVGQDIVVQILKESIIKNLFSHAYLFSGPRGTGKTSTAKIFAKAVNCLTPEDGQPCGKCRNCQIIQKQKASDIIELDAASNRGINEIRQLKESVRFKPVYLKYKVYIIDEAHMLTKEAFNALLKTLEEPPPYIIFILATTEPHKLPVTIISRCQHLEFKKLSLEVIFSKLKFVSDKENILISDQALKLIARFSDGALRDALNLLDQLSSFSDNIDIEDIYKLTKKIDFLFLDKFLYLLLNNKLQEVFKILKEFSDYGYDFRYLNYNLVEYLKNIIFYRLKIKIDIDDIEKYKLFNIEINDNLLYKLFSLLVELDKGIKESFVPELLFESYILKFFIDNFKLENLNSKNVYLDKVNLDEKKALKEEITLQQLDKFNQFLKTNNLNLVIDKDFVKFIKVDNILYIQILSIKSKLLYYKKRERFLDLLKKFFKVKDIVFQENFIEISDKNKKKLIQESKEKKAETKKRSEENRQIIYKDRLEEISIKILKIFDGKIEKEGKIYEDIDN